MTATIRKIVALLAPVLAAGTGWLLSGQAAPPPADKAVPDQAILKDLHGDPLPPHARARLGTTRFRQGSTIGSVRYLADGTLVTAGDRNMRFWDAATGREIRSFLMATFSPTALSPDHKLAVGTDPQGKVQVWDIATGKVLREIKPDAPPGTDVSSFYFGPDSKALAGIVNDNNGKAFVQLWDATTGKEGLKLVGPGPKEEGQQGFFPSSFSFSPDGKYLAAAGTNGNHGLFCIWEVSTGKLMPELAGHAARLNAGMGVPGQAMLQLPPSEGGGPLRFVFSPDGKTIADILLVPGKDDEDSTQTIGLWDVATGKHLRDVGKLTGGASRLTYAPDGKTLAVLLEANQAVHFFAAASGKEVSSIRVEGSVMALTFSPDSTIAAIGAADQTAMLLEVASGKELHRLRGFGIGVYMDALLNAGIEVLGRGQYLAFSPDGKTLAGTSGPLVRQWTVATGKEFQAIAAAHDGAILALTLSPDGKEILTVADDNTARVWDAASSKELRVFKGPTPKPDPNGMDFFGYQARTAAAAFAPDGKSIVIAWPTAGSIHILDAKTGKEIRSMTGHNAHINALVFAPDGKTFVSSGEDGRAIWWNATTGKPIRHLSGKPVGDEAPDPAVMLIDEPMAPAYIALAPDGRTLAEGGVNPQGAPRLRLWELTSGKLRREFTLPRVGNRERMEIRNAPGVAGRVVIGEDGLSGVGKPLFTPDGKAVAWTAGESIILFDAVRGREIRRFGTPELSIQSAAFSGDGRHLAAASQDGMVYVWETATGTAIGQLTGHRGHATTVAFLADGGTLASGAADTSVLFWDLPRFLAAQTTAPPGQLSPVQLAELWDTLAKDDAAAAGDAQERLVEAARQSVPWLRERLKATPPVDAKRLAELIADLESDNFAARKRATDALSRLGEAAEVTLRKRLDEKPPLESQKRIEGLLEKLNGPVTDSELLRSIRAVEVLEQVGSAEALDLLAAAPFYGGPAPLDAVEAIRAELLVVLAADDARVNAAWPGYEAALKQAGVTFDLFQPPGTVHGFHNDTTPRYSEAAAKEAWSRTLALFERRLRG